MKKIAVITGASSGMGREFVYAIDKDIELDELWVIARREDRLLELQPQVRAKIRPVVLDLLDRNSLSQFKALLDIGKARGKSPRKRGRLRSFRNLHRDGYGKAA